MAAPDGKKRKRESESSAKPKKKVAIVVPPTSATVSAVVQAKFCPPVIASSPGLELPEDTRFDSYLAKERPRSKATKHKNAGDRELLLRSTARNNLDLIAREERSEGPGSYLNHYVGIYDPQTGKLQVVEAKKAIVRGAVRSKRDGEAPEDEQTAKKTMMDLRADLGNTFGTRKAKKALNDLTLNAISPQKKGGDSSPAKIDAADRAMLSSVGEITATMATRDELQAVVDDAKPVPVANPDAEDIQDVYDPEAIIGKDILKLVPVQEWKEKARRKEGIQVASRFVAARVNALATNEDATTRLRVLRYLSFVLIMYLKSKQGRQKGTRALPSREKLREALAEAPEAVVENIRRKFSDGGEMRKFHIDLLFTHCCAFACIVDNFEVDTQNLRDDLRLQPKEMSQYFREIGGRVKEVSNKEAGGTRHIATLALPLEFPRQRHVVPRRR